MFSNGHYDKSNPPVLEDDHYQPYAKRTVGTIFSFAIILAAVFGFILWSAGDGEGDNQRSVASASNAQTGSDTTDRERNEDDGLLESGVDLVKDTIGSVTGEKPNGMAAGEADKVLEKNAKILANMNEGQRYAVANVIGQKVQDSDRQDVGTIEDIIINKETGDAQAIVVDSEGQGYTNNLKELGFEDVRKQTPSGAVYLNVTNEEFTTNPEFSYEKQPEQYISIRDLHDGQVLDVDGNVAGEVRTVLYRNAEAQKIYFELKPSLSPTQQPMEFGIPFESVDVVKNDDGYDIKLSKAQTEALAERLFATQ